VYFLALGGVSIWDANEAFYVETPREMMAAHDYINPAFNYLPRFNKPVLSYWIIAGFYKLFGISVGVQRLPIAIGAMVIVACAFVLGWMAAERTRPDGGGTERNAALWAALGLAAAPRLVMFARRIFIDIWITAFMSLTLTFFALSERHPERRRVFLAAMYVSVGLGALTKGPVAIVLPGLAFALYLTSRRELGRIREMMLPLGMLIVVAIVLPWYVALYQQHGWTYISSFFIGENIERYTSGLGVRQQRGLWFYPPVVLSDSFPIAVFLFTAAAIWWRERQPTQTLLWCWIAAIVLFFSFSAGKQDLYIFPIVAAVAGLGGAALHRTATDPAWQRWGRWTIGVTGALLAVAGTGVLWLFAAGGRVYELAGTSLVGALGLVGGVIALSFAAASRAAAAMLALCIAIIAINYTFVLRVLPDFERYKPVPAIASLLAPRLQPTDAVANYQVALPSMVYYLGRHVDEYFDREPFVQAVLSSRRLYAILSDDDYADLRAEIGRHTCVLYRFPTFDVKLKNVLAREPLPELFLISNQCH
jgi:4-amino-4-deoxy-L-arabinose transferase-like glycosyltransferase